LKSHAKKPACQHSTLLRRCDDVLLSSVDSEAVP
jgi:hypothetical protein